MARGRSKRAGTHRRGALYRPLCVLLIIGAILFSIGVFFRTLHVEVLGAVRYSEQEIMEASGIQKGKNLFLVDRGKAVEGILATMPYVRDVQISRKLPSTLEIRVEESPAVAYIQSGNSYWLLSPEGKVLEQADAAKAEGLIWVKGLEPESLEVGKEISVKAEDSANKEFLTATLRILTEKGLNEKVSALDAENSADLRFYYDERFVVRLGQNEDLENKMELLKAVVEQRNAAERGTINISYGKQANFIPAS